MTVHHTIRLPNQRSVTVREYVRSWRALKTLPARAQVRGFDHFPTDACDILREIHAGVHDRINKHVPTYGRGRKWDDVWQTECRRTAHAVNMPRLVVRWAPVDLRARLAHRLHTED